MSVLHDGELVDHHEVVVPRVVEVHQPHLLAAFLALFVDRHRHALRQQFVETLVVGQQVGGTDTQHRLDGLVQHAGG